MFTLVNGRLYQEEIERRGPGLFGNLFGRKPKADFSDVRSGGSTTAGAVSTPSVTDFL